MFDAATMDSKPLATVPIPHRVPAGFHGLHIKVRVFLRNPIVLALLRVFDAATMDSKLLATVSIPHRVPAGLHGLHC